MTQQVSLMTSRAVQWNVEWKPAHEISSRHGNVLQALRSGPIDPRRFVVPRVQGLRGESINTLLVQVVQSES
jgi:hypothetical protein